MTEQAANHRDVELKVRAQVLIDVEAKRHIDGNPDGESELSINEWIGRLQSAAKLAHSHARNGLVTEEYDVWVDLAAIAVARAEGLRLAGA